jgi:hypothetical protein
MLPPSSGCGDRDGRKRLRYRAELKKGGRCFMEIYKPKKMKRYKEVQNMKEHYRGF